MPISKEKKPVTLGETIQLIILAIVVGYVFITSPQMFRATAEAFYHNVFEFLWNSIFLYLCLRAILLLWVRPLFRQIFTDTSKLGQKLEWYDRTYQQLTPETKPLAIRRYGILFTLAALSMLIPYLPFPEARKWFPSFSMLLSQDAHTAYFKDYLAPLTNFESFAVFSFILWVLIAFEGRSRILARLLVMLETKKKNNEFTNPLPQNPFNPKSENLDIAIFSKQGTQAQHEEWCLMKEEDLRGNALIFSPIGGGKTQGIIKPFIEQVVAWQANNQEKKASIIVYDPKAELTEFTVDLARKIGRGDDLLVLSFDNPGVTINPIYTKNPWASQSASQMAGAIILAWINFQGKEPHDPYWLNQTYLLISHIIVYLFCEKGTNLTLYQVYEMWLTVTSGLSIKKSGRINALGLQILSYLYASDQEKFEQCFDKFTFEVDPKVPHSNELNCEKDALIEGLLRDFENERVSYHASTNEDLKSLVQAASEIPEDQLDENYPVLLSLEEQISELVAEDVKNEFSYNEYELDVRAYTKIRGLELQRELKESYGQDNDIEGVCTSRNA